MGNERSYDWDYKGACEGLRYLYVDPTRHSINYGDGIINYATLNLMSKYLPKPAGIFDWKTGDYPDGEYDFMIVPGVTMLTHGTRPGFDRIPQLNFPTYCLSGNVWAQLPEPGILLRSRVLECSKKNQPNLEYVRMMAGPVGCRDIFTYELLQKQGIEALYTGCPTLSLPDNDVADEGYVLFSFGRNKVRLQCRAAKRMSKKHHVIGICHEKSDSKKIRAAGWDLPLVDFHGDIELYMSYFKKAAIVISGRLHGTLPALAYGKKVYYFGTKDSRTTLLDDLGVHIHDYAGLGRAVEKADAIFNPYVYDYYMNNWKQLFETIIARHQG